MSQIAVKCQAVADFLADRPVLGSSKFCDDLLDEIAKVCITQTSFEEYVW